MSKIRKDGKFINFYMDSSIVERLKEESRRVEMTQTDVAEAAIISFLALSEKKRDACCKRLRDAKPKTVEAARQKEIKSIDQG